MNSGNDNGSLEPAGARRRHRLGRLFLAGWTAFACAAVWWLVRRAGVENAPPDWILGGDALANVSLAQRLGNWLRLLDLSVHGIYPFILLAPYAAWLGARFSLEQGRWPVSLPMHLAGAALFVAATHLLASRISADRHYIVAFKTEARISSDGRPEIISTNDVTNLLANLPGPPWPLPAGAFGGYGGGVVTQTLQTNLAGGVVRGAFAWGASDEPPANRFFFGQRRESRVFGDLLHLLGYAAVLGLVHAVHFHDRSRERERRAAALEVQLTQARLNALQAQLHPHFLFNALNAIATLLRCDPRAAQDALASFSDLLRLALSHSTQCEVPLREDVEFLRRYVEIQQTRLGSRLRFEEEIDPGALDHLVPAILLQPLVENAIRHGIEPSPDPGLVRVVVHPEGDRLYVLVEDNGAGLSNNETGRDPGLGIGLQNLRLRLGTLYGRRQRIEVGSRRGGGASVRIEIPLRPARVLVEARAVS